ncbi:MAG TPA: glycosyl hydrolase [Candidatus Woesebacteria bacterium]|nr:glycosyl hydrolase [Candidatus Woesebacteria bacterium]
MSLFSQKNLSFLFLPFLFILIYFLPKIYLDLRKSASGTLASIVIDTQNPGSNLSPALWQNLAQGGEEPTDMIKPVISQLRLLRPQLIRVDHLFDYYQVDKGSGQYDFSRLDEVVDSIVKTGARPLLSLSYTPDAKEPSDWNQWNSLVKATAHRYSIEKNISGIYYEVWNEPDLFGGWHYAKSPNYPTLYINSARAVADGAKGSIYKVGGPATTGYYPNWIKSLFATASKNKVPLDFISWHKYSKNISEYLKDFDDLNKILSDYPQYFDIERLITEIGPSSEPDTWYDNQLSGIHLISLCTQLSGKIHRLFTFEAIDGPSSRSDKSTGWGILTHQGKTKPRYHALLFLNQISGPRLPSTGDGSWVTSFSTKKASTIQTLVVNYDPDLKHYESTPITYQGLIPDQYQLKISPYQGQSRQKTVTITSSSYTENLYLEPNTAYLLELSPLSKK